MENLLIDFYELTMGQGYFDNKMHEKVAYFDLFFRRVPDKGSFVIANGVNKVVEYLLQFSFTAQDIEYLKSLNRFSDDYLTYLQTIKFTGDMWAVKDGTVVFANEPVITIKAPLLQGQLVETMLLVLFNRSSLITTKASRIVRSAQGRDVLEFGTRRAQGIHAAVDGALDTYIAGAIGTACTLTAQKYGVPAVGTMAHSFVQSFENEYDSFVAYAKSFPSSCTLLVDTYNTLNSGVVNAIKVNKEILAPMGEFLKGIRIDSGDLAYLSKQARKMLDEAGLEKTKIIVSNSLDENIIQSLLLQRAPIDVFGVGENMITAKSQPVFGGVYKLVATEENGNIVPKIKVSDNIEKITNPHFKKIYRIFDENNMFATDIIALYNENPPTEKLSLVHPQNPWVKKEIKNYKVIEIKEKFIENGVLIKELPSISKTRSYVQQQLSTLWEEAKRLENPHLYTINLSDKLTILKQELINKNS
jgi:nicotinate phosphoribosyltransferase